MKVPPNGEIVDVKWRSAGRSVVFVAVQYPQYWQAYVSCPQPVMLPGFFVEEPSEKTEFYCATHGAKLSWEEAKAFFPHLDITQYKTYPKEPYK